ncbi:MAG: GNAT family N-acetyltransferase [Tannerella sp.]|jgi:aminoglycoside 6'-N-acetyltransferase I|nr:GNAT family N-acetyltransferase [Tannerella sp.]
MEQEITVRQLKQTEGIPYDLLLLADETKESIDKYIYASDIYIAESEGEKVAVYALYRVSDEEIEIKNIAVVPHLQNQGIGRWLLKDAEYKAKADGYHYLLIATADAGIRQLQLYQRCDFEMYEIRKNFFAENFSEPIYENGIQLKHMVVLRKEIE